MRNLVLFLKEFFQNKGLLVFLSILIEKVVGLCNTIFVVRMISEKDYGEITLIASLFGVFITLNGFGAVQGLLRYGALEKEKNNKIQLSNYIFKEGLKRHFLLIISFFIMGCFYEFKYFNIWIIVLFFSIRMLGYYLYVFLLNYYRIHNSNDKFAKISIFINLVGLFLAFSLTYYLGKYGYLIGLCITPWIALLFYKKEIFSTSTFKLKDFNKKDFWKYSMNSSLTYFLSEFLFMIDIVLIGLLLNEKAVANYKVAIILPMNLMFIPLIFMQTDYSKIVSNSRNIQYLKFYIRNYYKLFVPISILILLIGFFTKDWILPFVFGKDYNENGWIFFVILLAIVFNMCFRNLYGNLLSAVGLANKNLKVAIFSIIMMLILGYVLTNFLGILGSAIALAITFITMGFYSAFIFSRYLHQLENNI
ncbi:oligosaccharide flippase family protein [Empedobacter brevis]|uniref:oligosaccharide flippase family protein n=1 Tax=Empedobacter brevis TaxID=247 RepID=UPI0039AEC635